ncbi:MAG: NfeD family protein [Candidatus Gastranaerophilales bacterium]|nr:NfeD family protein [Candidatus Gastranaerophilales bacterium]
MWQLILCIGLLFLILEMFTPAMFFLNFAIAAFICALLSLFTTNITILIIVFCVLSVVLMFTLRPLLMKNQKTEQLTTGMESKYVGKVARVVEDVDKEKGAVSIYDERWQARNVEEGVIPCGSNVKIESYESIVMYVRKV